MAFNPSGRVCGVPMETESALGAAHIAPGELRSHTEGTVDAVAHLDCVMRDATLELDRAARDGGWSARVRRPRILLAKPGLDGHDRGIKVIAMALRDAGAEVVYLGPSSDGSQEIVHAAIQEDVDVIGISVLSGAHLPLAGRLVPDAGCGRASASPSSSGARSRRRTPPRLKELGVAAVYPVGTGLNAVVDGVLELASRERVEP